MKYAYSRDRPVLSDISNVDGILPGELVYCVSGGGLRRATGADPRMDGVVEDFADQHIADNAYDYRSSIDDFSYDTGMRVQFDGHEDGARFRALTPVDDGDGDPAPNIQEWDVVGVPDRSGMEGRLVQEGYTDGQSTPVTYNRSNGNFLAVGIARATASSVPTTSYDELTNVVRRTDL